MTRSRQLAAFMSTDIEGYTALTQQNVEKAIQTRENCNNHMTHEYASYYL
jgi:hypothetical protein